MPTEIQTALSHIDGEAGRLTLRDQPIEALAGRLPFERVLGLLWRGEVQWIDLGAARVAAAERLAPILAGPVLLDDPMDSLRAILAALPPCSPRELVAATGLALCAWVRGGPTTPDPAAGHAADLLRMMRGAPASEAEARALDAYLVTVCDHGLNASTFTARVVASTGSDRVSAVVAAVGALKGPLHGGAPGPVLDMLDAIESADRADAWLRAELAAGRRIMGMGHRVYRVRDPRAAVLERAVAGLGASPRIALAHAVEAAAERILTERYPGRRLRANVEFYTATLLEALGVPRAAFPATFAAARVGGWLAHYDEQRAFGRLIRPRGRPRSLSGASV